MRGAYHGTRVVVAPADASDEKFIVNEPEHAYFIHPVHRGDTVVASWGVEDVHLLEEDRAAGTKAAPYGEEAA